MADLASARIMMVDDEPVNLKLAQAMLRTAGYQNTVMVQDPRNALGEYRKEQVDLILLDLNMPHMDGYALMAQLKSLGDPLLPPILVLTAQGGHEHLLRALQAGARDFVAKPFDRTELLMRVRNLIEAQQAHRALFNQHALLEEQVLARTLLLQHEIDHRQQAQAAQYTLLQEKIGLLSEVHHRVKNNLQVIASLLRLEDGRNSASDRSKVLQDMQGRIRAMALLHESLYRSGTTATLDLGAYLKQLAAQSYRALAPANGSIRLKLDVVTVQLAMDQASPCGLMVNELISNSLKHGFPDGRTGEICVALKVLDDPLWVELRISDNGVGLPDDFDEKRQVSLGLKLAGDLARQIGGTLEVGPGQQAAFTVKFQVASIPNSTLPPLPPSPPSPQLPPTTVAALIDSTP